jgi:hypothetical protein
VVSAGRGGDRVWSVRPWLLRRRSGRECPVHQGAAFCAVCRFAHSSQLAAHPQRGSRVTARECSTPVDLRRTRSQTRKGDPRSRTGRSASHSRRAGRRSKGAARRCTEEGPADHRDKDCGRTPACRRMPHRRTWTAQYPRRSPPLNRSLSRRSRSPIRPKRPMLRLGRPSWRPIPPRHPMRRRGRRPLGPTPLGLRCRSRGQAPQGASRVSFRFSWPAIPNISRHFSVSPWKETLPHWSSTARAHRTTGCVTGNGARGAGCGQCGWHRLVRPGGQDPGRRPARIPQLRPPARGDGSPQEGGACDRRGGRRDAARAVPLVLRGSSVGPRRRARRGGCRRTGHHDRLAMAARHRPRLGVGPGPRSIPLLDGVRRNASDSTAPGRVRRIPTRSSRGTRRSSKSSRNSTTCDSPAHTRSAPRQSRSSTSSCKRRTSPGYRTSPEPIAEFARIWRRVPKVVFSKTLRGVRA